MELIGALAAGIAVFAALMTLLPSRAQPTLALGMRLREAYGARIEGAANLSESRNSRAASMPATRAASSFPMPPAAGPGATRSASTCSRASLATRQPLHASL